MAQSQRLDPEAIETAHFEKGSVEVMAPSVSDTFSMPSSPVPKWVSDIVARRQLEICMDEQTLPHEGEL